MPDDVNVNSDSGEEQQGSLDPGLFPGIEDVPAEYRQHIDPILLEAQKNAQAKITEVNGRLKAWEPYEQLGIQDKIDPETMQGLLGFAEIVEQAENENPEALQQWWNTVGQQFNFLDQGGEEGLDDSFDEEDTEFMSQQEIDQLVAQRVEEGLAPVFQEKEQREQEQMLNQADATIQGELDEIRKQFGDFDEEVEKDICTLALPYPEESIKKGFERYQQMVENAKGELFATKADQPPTPERSGIANTTAPKITSFEDATAAAEARLLESQQ